MFITPIHYLLFKNKYNLKMLFRKCPILNLKSNSSLINFTNKNSLFPNYFQKQTRTNFSKNLKEEYLIMYSLASSKSNDICIITINNASKRNAFCLDMTNDLIKILKKINNDFSKTKSPKVIIMTTTGECFSSGHDLSEISVSSATQRAEIFSKFSELGLLMTKIDPIIIGEVQGLATAAGCQLACSCDLIVASSKSKFEMPGLKIGLFPQTPAVPLVRLIGAKRAMQMLLTAEPVDSAKALEWGIVNEIVDVNGISFEKGRDKLREASVNLAERICNFSHETLGFGKKLFICKRK
jgi:enoyl-CoA hydratase/carnithine racemase